MGEVPSHSNSNGVENFAFWDDDTFTSQKGNGVENFALDDETSQKGDTTSTSTSVVNNIDDDSFGNARNEDYDKETAIVITTTLVSRHALDVLPALDMLNETLRSFNLLSGLSPNTPIYINVDQLPPDGTAIAKVGQERVDQEETLEKYMHALYRAYEQEENIHIIGSAVNLHVGASLGKVLSVLDPRTKFVYQVQHDFKFITEIDHAAIVKTMREHPDVLRLVRFNKIQNVQSGADDLCWNQTDAVNFVNRIHFTKTNQWSDNNHFSSVHYYKEILKRVAAVENFEDIFTTLDIKSIRRALEAPMMNNTLQNCSYWGPHYYGKPLEGPHILHLDGSNRVAIPKEGVRPLEIARTTDNHHARNMDSSDENFDKETAIIITTNLVPSHPALDMLNETISSLHLLSGVSPNTPIYITIDQFPPHGSRNAKGGQERVDQEETLEKYIHALYRAYGQDKQIHIIVSAVHLHIGGSFAKALSVLDPRTKFVYQVQHDFKFITEIDHTAIVKTMREHPDVLRLVRFNKRQNIRGGEPNQCWNQTDAVNSVNGIQFTKTNQWSDNNHFSSVCYYKEMLKRMAETENFEDIFTTVDIKSIRRALEAPMMNVARGNCSYWGPHYYGKPLEGPHLHHLDGRLGYVVPNSIQSN